MELPRHQASVALVVPVELQLSSPRPQQLQVDSAVTVAMPQAESAATAERAVQQLAMVRVRLHLVGSVVSAALRPQEQLE